MGFSTKGVEVKSFSNFQTSPYIQIGPNEVKITSISYVKSSGGDKFQTHINLETKPIKEEGFKPADNASGQVGRVKLGIYTNGTGSSWNDITRILIQISEQIDCRTELDAIDADNIGDYFAKVSNLFKGKYFWLLIGGEEYLGEKDGTPVVKSVIKLIASKDYGLTAIAKTQDELKNRMKGKEFPAKGQPDTQWYFKQLTQMDSDKVQESINNSISSSSNETDQLPF